MAPSRPRLTSIGKYEVEDVIGEGAMGVVYRASDKVLNRPVAIKVMSDAIAQDTDLRERFLREAQAAGSLQHPHVVTIYDFGELDGHLYIAMEYVEGEDLEDLLKKRIDVPLEAKLELIIGVLQGLAFAHKRGVIHRDIKPANIRIDSEGKARLMDFGVAHLSSSNMTRTGMMLGTPSYMAPEQIAGGPVSPQTDIFSVGAVLYELLTGTRPFRGESLQALMYQVLSTTPRTVRELVPGLPSALEAVVGRAMQKEQTHRYGNALEMADALAEIRLGLKSNSPSGTVSLRASLDTALAAQRAAVDRKRRRREFRYVALGGLAVLTIGAAVIGTRELARHQLASSARESRAGDTEQGVSPTPAGERLGAQAPESLLATASTAPPPNPAAQNPPAPERSTTRRDPADSPLRAPPPVTTPSESRTRELALARSLQDAALENRRRAAAAGATAEQLRAGDSHNDDGEEHIRGGRITEAATAFSNAAAAWTVAERLARQAVSEREVTTAGGGAPGAAPGGTPTNTETRRDTARDTATVPRPSAPARDTPSGAAAAAPLPTPAEARTDIAAIVEAYARALESRDIAELRRVYPSMTPQERTAFEDFFRATRSLRASLAVSDLTLSGATAEARLSGTYDYVTSAGDSERRPVGFQAAFSYESGAWRLVRLR